MRLLHIRKTRLLNPLLEVVIDVHGLVGFDAAGEGDFVEFGEVGACWEGAVVGVDLCADFDGFNPSAGVEVSGFVLG